MNRQDIIKIANKVSRFYDDMAEFDEEIRVCGYGKYYRKELHIYRDTDLLEIAYVMGAKPKLNERKTTIEVMINGVCFFTLLKSYTVSEFYDKYAERE
jgi:hypothetical protein